MAIRKYNPEWFSKFEYSKQRSFYKNSSQCIKIDYYKANLGGNFFINLEDDTIPFDIIQIPLKISGNKFVVFLPKAERIVTAWVEELSDFDMDAALVNSKPAVGGVCYKIVVPLFEYKTKLSNLEELFGFNGDFQYMKIIIYTSKNNI